MEENFELKNLTSFKIGGKADRAWFPKNKDEFVYLLQTLDAPTVLGGMSNVLVSDKGIADDVIITFKMTNVEFNSAKVLADCGVRGAFLSQEAQKQGLSGFEFMIGFPGTVGGNVYMNASAHAQSISDSLLCAYVFDGSQVRKMSKADLEFGYRTSILQRSGAIVLSAEFELQKAEPEAIMQKMAENLFQRRLKQPSLALPNAGSIFKNPPDNSAGKLLESSGAKGLKEGAAAVFEKHANFIVNTGGATSENVLKLMLEMQKKVNSKYAILLEPEIKILGQLNKNEEKIWKILYAK